MSSRERPLAEACSLMLAFAERTGLESARPPRRYLWTDAYAVRNLLALARETGQDRFRELAIQLVDQVHHVLGRHREDDRRNGWISGLAESDGELHPTRGGLRIGKRLPERPRGAPFDAAREWDRDGQYFHYLTQWMHALDQVARSTGELRFNTWARELAETAHRSFTTGPPGHGRRMAWKMSIDLSRPLVPSMGHHDPLDGFIACLELEATASALPGAPSEPDLKNALADFAALIEGRDWATADPLGLGGLLMLACRVAQLTAAGSSSAGDLLEILLAAALEGLADYSRQGDLHRPASVRLAFRELGLASGLAALERIGREVSLAPDRFPSAARVRARLQALEPFVALAAAIGSFWSDPSHRLDDAWAEHRDIDEVMLATCLLPEAMLVVQPLR